MDPGGCFGTCISARQRDGQPLPSSPSGQVGNVKRAFICIAAHSPEARDQSSNPVPIGSITANFAGVNCIIQDSTMRVLGVRSCAKRGGWGVCVDNVHVSEARLVPDVEDPGRGETPASCMSPGRRLMAQITPHSSFVSLRKILRRLWSSYDLAGLPC